MFTKKIGIDLGTVNTLIFLPKRGIVLNEPSTVAMSKGEKKILAIGRKAQKMSGKAPEEIIVLQPLCDGVIADYKATEAMLVYFINKVSGFLKLFRPEVMVTVPVGITSTERRAVVGAVLKAGAKNVYLLKDPIASAIGAGIKITSPSGNMVIDIGGGTTDIAVISLGGIVSSACVRVGGNKIDKSIIAYIKKRHNLAIGEATAEKIKINIGSALSLQKEEFKKIKGRDLISGLPRAVKIYSSEITQAIQEDLEEIFKIIKLVLQETPPELVSDIMDKGMILTGGGGLLRNLDTLISQNIGVPCHVVDDVMFCAANGLGKALDNLDNYKQNILSAK